MKRRERVFAATIAGSLVAVLAILGFLRITAPDVVQANPGTHYVAPGGHCNGATPCHATIQAAVDAAGSGDEIRVAAGTYTGAHTDVVTVWSTPYTYTQVVIITKSLTLRGGFTPANWTTPNPTANVTTIDAQRHGRGVTIVGDGTQSVTLDGFTITGGDYTGLGNPPGGYLLCGRTGGDCGGGLFARYVRLIVRNCNITDNIASRTSQYSDGGGMYLWYLLSGSRVEDTDVISNSATASDGEGGGMYVEYGGGVSFSRTMIALNHATGSGGGMMVFQPDGPVTIEVAEFVSNTVSWPSEQGGALAAKLTYQGDALRMDRVGIAGSETPNDGTALLLKKQGSGITRAVLTNMILAGNRSTSAGNTNSVILVDGQYDFDVSLAQLTVADNPTPSFLRAIAPRSGHFLTVSLTNTLIVSATNAFVAYQDPGGTYSGNVLIRHIKTLTHNVTTLHKTENGSPTFQAVSPLTGDPKLDNMYRLTAGSAAIDVGVDSGVNHDVDNEKRPMGLGYDIGADEYLVHQLFLPLIMR
ncbi:MAG: hypothetical protein GXP41_03740 [Chloroflexi bacterium]|nr:hypothetical protein [Chloroflexota bacterium]